MQWFWDNIRVESRTATAANCEQEKVGKKEGRLNLRDMNMLKGALSEMGVPTKLVGLWAPYGPTFGWTTCGGLRGNGAPCPHSVLSGVRGGISR